LRNSNDAMFQRALGPLAPWAKRLPYIFRIPLDAFLRFDEGDGWAIASHIALSTLMSLFPFLIVVNARIVLDAMPNLSIPAKVSSLATEAQMTPSEVESKSPRESPLVRVRLLIDHTRLDADAAFVRTAHKIIGAVEDIYCGFESQSARQFLVSSRRPASEIVRVDFRRQGPLVCRCPTRDVFCVGSRPC